jgi:hypothetical protein
MMLEAKATLKALVLAAVLVPLGLNAAASTGRPPDKLSDLYKFFNQSVRQGLGAEVTAWPIRIQGRSWELLKDARFPEVELILRPFETQGLRFEKAEFLFRRLQLDRDRLLNWELDVREVREVQTRLVFTLRSLGKKLSDSVGEEVRLRSDMNDQVVLLTGPGRFLGVACQVQARVQPVWDEKAKTVILRPLEQSFGGRDVPRWLWWLGRSPVPKEPVLDLGFSWIPFNIQEVHVGWDHVNLSTDW